ncbi:5-dehydro-2-deoxygluconokinase [Amnibacterium flavum]|uniref:5-dehydro-2-deoxygluconokinase n=1 Tax=Amnibacterium flavum TaxID=2173173 RepID=A0A2V1HVV9_9MICO|nr:5-dehydro-2-deoxygluconokinase [Amnibacterium flavum]PVZ95190.1 5-dehydro-2-deoxygluconokinase [Amnibacterium flavum]
MTGARPDVVVAGRICIDLYPTVSGVRLEDVPTFSKSIGGSATNVAVAAARHGLAVTILTRTGDDPFGRYAVEELARFGVDTRHVHPVAGIPSVLTFCEMFPPDDFPLYIWRNPTAPDMYLDGDDIPLDEVAAAKVFWATATGLSREPSRAAHFAAWQARGRVPHTVLDLDYRPMFWDGLEQASAAVRPALEHVTVAIGNADECEMAVDERDPDRAADALLSHGVELAIVKRGPRGVLAKTRDQRIEVPPIPVDVVNGLGAGDAFGGALCRGLIEGWPLERTLQFANAAGAIVATRYECSTAMPTGAEVDEFLAARSATTGSGRQR